MTSVDVFGRQFKKTESNFKLLSNGGLDSINDSLSIKVDPNTNNILSLSANGVMASGIKSTGGMMTGNLNMKNNKITDLSDPVTDGDASNKKFVQAEIKSGSVLTKLYIDTLLDAKLDRKFSQNFDMNGLKIVNVRNPIDPLDVVNKLYAQIFAQKDDLTVEKLIKIGDVMYELFNIYRNNNILNNYSEEFITARYYAATMASKYSDLYEDRQENISELLHSCTLFTDLKVVIIRVIEILPGDIFTNLKSELMAANLISTPEEKTLRRRYRRFINRSSKAIDPTRSNKQLEFLIQKNLLLIDLGFIYFIDNLLNKLLVN